MFKKKFCLNVLKVPLVFVLMFSSMSVFSQNEDPMSFLKIWIVYPQDPDDRNIKKVDNPGWHCFYYNNTVNNRSDKLSAVWVIENIHPSKKIEFYTETENHHFGGNKWDKFDDIYVEKDLRTFKPGTAHLVYCRRKRDETKDSDGIYIVNDEFSQPKIIWARFVE